MGGARPGSAGVSGLGQLLRQKYWQQDARGMQSADTQDSNMLAGLPRRDEDDRGSADTLADMPPSYTSKSATLPLDSRAAADDEMTLDYEDQQDWQSSPHHRHLDEPVRSIEYAEDSEDEPPDFGDSSLAQSDMVASGSSHLAPVTETAIDDDEYESIHVPPRRPDHDLVLPTDRELPLPVPHVRSPMHPSRHASPAPSDSSAGHHHHHHAPQVESRPESRGGLPRAHKTPPPPPPPRRHHHVEEDVPAVPFDPFESLPPPVEMMIPPEGFAEEDVEEEEEELPVPHSDQLHFDDDVAPGHPYWPGSRPTDL